MRINDWISNRIFKFVHGRNLVYNTCWEDPRLDREAMNLGPDDRVMVITSAGCNALDYALDSPAQVYAVDMNPRQNALLELKMAGIRNLEFVDFQQMFGQGLSSVRPPALRKPTATRVIRLVSPLLGPLHPLLCPRQSSLLFPWHLRGVRAADQLLYRQGDSCPSHRKSDAGRERHR